MGRTRISGTAAAVLLALAVLGGLAARAAATTADDLCAPTADPCVVSGQVQVDDQSVIDVGTRELRIASGGALDVDEGEMTLRAGLLTVEEGGSVRASGSASTIGGLVSVTAEEIAILGEIDARGSAGGEVTLAATGTLVLSGEIDARALQREQTGGNISLSGRTIAVSGELSVLGGPEESGGEIEISATADLDLTGVAEASGGDGGAVVLESGAGLEAGNLTVGAAAEVKADATGSGGSGGEIEMTAAGDGETTGHVTVDGLLSAKGRSGSADFGGGLGGDITITASGDIMGSDEAALITVEGGGPDGDGGNMDLETEAGRLDLMAGMDVLCSGSESGGGLLTIDIVGDVTIGGFLDSTAADGGDIEIGSSEGSVVVASSAGIDVGGTSGGDGGDISIESGRGGGPAAVRIDGALSANGEGDGGTGGGIEIVGDALVSVKAPISAEGGTGTASGGDISIVVGAGPAMIEAAMLVSAAGGDGFGGVVQIEAQTRVGVSATIDASGSSSGGYVDISTAGSVTLSSPILASAEGTGQGGRIEVVSGNAVTISGRLVTDGGAAMGGLSKVTGCTITVCGLDAPDCPQTGILSSLGPNGTNRLIGRDLTVVLGSMRADPTTGRNELVYDGTGAREPVVLGDLTPAGLLVVDENLLPCPGCGNGVTEPPETCDDGNQLDGDGCSAECQVEDPIRGDVNGDFIVSPDDLRHLISELFDGDGDAVGMVSAGTFRGTPGADANQDERITGADLTSISQLLGGV